MAAEKLLTEAEAAAYISERASIPLSRRTLESCRRRFHRLVLLSR